MALQVEQPRGPQVGATAGVIPMDAEQSAAVCRSSAAFVQLVSAPHNKLVDTIIGAAAGGVDQRRQRVSGDWLAFFQGLESDLGEDYR